ncbi:MAG: hypothetical protein JO087_09830 [Actinobacteria bacterium]|nr:hypothetical protein [Actinomycetota bacterium]
MAVAMAAMGGLAAMHLRDAPTARTSIAAGRTGSLSASSRGLGAAVAARSSDVELFDVTGLADRGERATPLPFALLLVAGAGVALAARRRTSTSTPASLRELRLSVRSSRAPPVVSH